MKNGLRKLKRMLRRAGTLLDLYIFNMILLVVAFALIVVIINYSFSNQNKVYQVDYNYSALKGVQNLLEEQEREFMDAVRKVYNDSTDKGSVSQHISSLEGQSQELEQYPISSYFRETRSSAHGAQVIYVARSGYCYIYMEDKVHVRKETGDLMTGMQAVYENYKSGLEMTATTFYNGAGTGRSYGMVHCIRDISARENVGAIQFEYKTKAIDSLLEESYPSVKGEFLIVSESGEVFYDSTGIWYDQKYPYVEQLLESTDSGAAVRLGNDKYYVNSFDKGMEFYPELHVFGIVSHGEVYEGVGLTIRAVVSVLVAIFLVFGVAMFLNIHRKTLLLKQIHAAMGDAREGNLQSYVDVSGIKQNELTDIAESFNGMVRQLQSYIEKEYQLKMEQQEYLLMALHAQLNPHFLLNTFEAIRMKAMVDGEEEIEQMIVILSKIFYNAAKGDNIVTLETEVGNCESFLRLHQIRFDRQLSYRIDIPEEIESYATVCYSLQVIVENYMMHSFDSSRDDNHISITGRLENGWITVTIRDNSDGITPEKLEEIRRYADYNGGTKARKSIGLSNMCRSMHLVFGEDFRFDADVAENGGLQTMLSFRACLREDLKNGVQSDDRRG